MAVTKDEAIAAKHQNDKQALAKLAPTTEDMDRMARIEAEIDKGLMTGDRKFTVASYGGTYLIDYVRPEHIGLFVDRYISGGWKVTDTPAEWIGWDLHFD